MTHYDNNDAWRSSSECNSAITIAFFNRSIVLETKLTPSRRFMARICYVLEPRVCDCCRSHRSSQSCLAKYRVRNHESRFLNHTQYQCARDLEETSAPERRRLGVYVREVGGTSSHSPNPCCRSRFVTTTSSSAFSYNNHICHQVPITPTHLPKLSRPNR